MNPEVFETIATGGRTSSRAQQPARRHERGQGRLKISMTTPAFELGVNIATTPGKTVSRTRPAAHQ
jgi:hypothetical protein